MSGLVFPTPVFTVYLSIGRNKMFAVFAVRVEVVTSEK